MSALINASVFRDTLRQRNSPLFHSVRVGRITGTSLYDAVTCKSDDTGKRLSNQLLDPKPYLSYCPAVRHGIDFESVALCYYYEAHKERVKSIKPCGVLLNRLYPFLSATPDGIVELSDGSLLCLEVKCLYYVGTPKSTQHLMEERRSKAYLQFDSHGTTDSTAQSYVTLKKTNRYYYQVQLQLGLAGLNLCHFVVYNHWYGNEVTVVEVPFDESFFSDCVEKASKFSNRYLQHTESRQLSDSSSVCTSMFHSKSDDYQLLQEALI